MLNPNSVTASMLKRAGVDIDGAPSTAKSQSSASSIDLTGKILRLPSGKVITVVEDTGRDSYRCMYDVPEVPSFTGMSKEQLHEARKVEFRKSFLLKFGEEYEWTAED